MNCKKNHQIVNCINCIVEKIFWIVTKDKLNCGGKSSELWEYNSYEQDKVTEHEEKESEREGKIIGIDGRKDIGIVGKTSLEL